MRNYFRKLKSSNYFKALAVLTSGSMMGTLIIALRHILQTRIFSADDVGIYTFLLAVPTMFIGVMSMRYDIAIITERDEQKVFALIKLSFILIVTLGVGISMFFIFYIVVFNPEYIRYLYVTPFVFLVLVGYGLYNMLSSYNNRCKEYKLISSMYVVRSFVQHGGVLVLGYLFVKMAGLKELSILVMVVPYGCGLFAGVRRQSRTLMNHKEEIRAITKIEMIEVARIHRYQPIISTPALFLNSFSFSIITIIIERLYNTVVLGYYSVSNRVLGMPISLVAGNVAKLFIEKASSEYNSTGKFIKAYKQSVSFLSVIAIFMFLGMFLLAPPLSEMLFGKGWGEAGEYIKILSPMFSFRLIGTSISQGLVVCNKQKMEFIFNIMMTFASVGSGVLAWILKGDITTFLTILSITRSICYTWLIIIMYCYATGNPNKVKREGV